MKNIGLILILLVFSCSKSTEETYNLVITNTNLIDGTGSEIQPNKNIYIKDGIIVKIDSGEAKPNKNVVDGTDKYVIPGLFDAHVHTTNYQRDLPLFVHFGVTSIFVTGGSKATNDYYSEMRAFGNDTLVTAPRVFHTSQHFITEGSHPVKTYSTSNWIDGETYFTIKDTIQIENLVREVAQQPIKGIKLTIEDGPAPPFIERIPQEFVTKIAKEAKKNNTRVFAHVSDNIELKMAFDAKINDIIHYVGVDIDFERDTDLLDYMYNNDVSIVTTLMIDKSFLYPLYKDWINTIEAIDLFNKEEVASLNDSSEIERAKRYTNMLVNEFNIEEPIFQNLIVSQVQDIDELYKNGVNMVIGTDTGNTYIFPGYSVHEEMQLMELGGMQPIDIIKMATHNAAKMLDELDNLGTIETGKIADMILLNKNPLETIKNTLSINTVINDGIIQKRLK
ncbi:MAG: amidohydrolase family protein [Flavobacteriaceae bacterium]